MKRIVVLASVLAILASTVAISAGSARAFVTPINVHQLRVMPGAPAKYFTAATRGYVQVGKTTIGTNITVTVQGLNPNFTFNVFAGAKYLGDLSFDGSLHHFSGTIHSASVSSTTGRAPVAYHVYIKAGSTAIGPLTLMYTPDLIGGMG
ncbi:MAG TPA: hypothetical protein VKX16_10170 [Chloroflexota bacterium]|nr:hypothetical protein [Chloroflexota bacterium]